MLYSWLFYVYSMLSDDDFTKSEHGGIFSLLINIIVEREIDHFVILL